MELVDIEIVGSVGLFCMFVKLSCNQLIGVWE